MVWFRGLSLAKYSNPKCIIGFWLLSALWPSARRPVGPSARRPVGPSAHLRLPIFVAVDLGGSHGWVGLIASAYAIAQFVGSTPVGVLRLARKTDQNSTRIKWGGGAKAEVVWWGVSFFLQDPGACIGMAKSLFWASLQNEELPLALPLSMAFDGDAADRRIFCLIWASFAGLPRALSKSGRLCLHGKWSRRQLGDETGQVVHQPRMKHVHYATAACASLALLVPGRMPGFRANGLAASFSLAWPQPMSPPLVNSQCCDER